MNDQTAALEQRLQRLEDILQIQQLFVDYGHYLDSGDFASYAALFAEDGEVMLGPMGKANGRAEIEALMTKTLAGRIGQSFHVISNPIVDIDGDKASSDVMWTVVTRGPDDNAVLSMIGRHKDDLVRENGQWRFRRRRGFVDIPGTYRN